MPLLKSTHPWHIVWILPLLLLAQVLSACQPLSNSSVNLPMSTNTQHPTAMTTVTATAIPQIPTPTAIISSPIPTLQACLEKTGTISPEKIDSVFLKNPLSYDVYLPPCYQQETTRRYPVLYLLHGQGYDDDQWIRMGVTDTANQLINAKTIPPFIIILPNDPDWRQPGEYGFEDAFLSELIPQIDQEYRTLAERSDRAVGGLSRGAAWAIHLGLKDWQTFGIIGAHSLPVFWSDAPLIQGWLDSIPPDQTPRIYLDIGRSDRELASATEFENMLNLNNIPHEWHLFQGYHDEAYWSSHINQYLEWYTQDW